MSSRKITDLTPNMQRIRLRPDDPWQGDVGYEPPFMASGNQVRRGGWADCFCSMDREAQRVCPFSRSAMEQASMNDRWKNRRRMAWGAFWASVLFPLLVFVADSSQLTAIAMPFYMFTGAVVGAYIGFATADDKWQKQDGDR